ncbi:L-asparaginase [Salmonella enterica subsp. arizonae]|nr:L-asparaginase [Salmonella enterica subsp. arizonae]
MLLASLNTGSAQNPHVLRVRSGFSALPVFKLSSPITPTEQGLKDPAAQTMPI